MATKLMTKIDAIKFFKIFLIIDIAVLLFCILQENTVWLVNSQIAFFGSLSVSIGSYFGYLKNVQNRIPDEPIDIELERDAIDKIDDPYELDDEINEEKQLSDDEIKQILKEEKDKQKQNSLKNTIFSMGGFASVYRIIGYFILLVGFFVLVKNNIFEPISYLLGLILVPFGALFFGFFGKFIR